MLDRKWIARAACLGVAAFSLSLASAPARGAVDEPYSLGGDAPPVYLDPVAPEPTPALQDYSGVAAPMTANRALLMSTLDRAGAGPMLEEARVNIFGHAEMSYTYNTDNPAQGLNLGRVFDINDNRIQINQISLDVERKADPHQWDIGGRIDFLYGTDARFIHSSDFIDYGNKNSSSSSKLYNGPEYQFDIPQLYVDMTLPFGQGIRVRLGKFLFFKQIDPNASVFFSHSFTFGAALPFTLTGITAYYPISEQLSIEGGFSRGWGQTFTDNNGAIDGLGRVRYQINRQMDLSFAAITGPELNGDNSHYRTVFDGTLTYEYDSQWTFLCDAVYGYQAQPSSLRDDQWYGVSGYAVYKLSRSLNINGRLEAYRDEEGFTTGVTQTLFEGTLGVTITPFPTDSIGQNFKIRPEVRYDYSNARYFNGLTDHDQWTLALDAYFDF